MSARHRTVALAAFLLVAICIATDAHAQRAPAEPWRDRVLSRDEFTAAYRRARDTEAAEALMIGDPASLQALEVLVRAERTEAAFTLAERVAFLFASPEIHLTTGGGSQSRDIAVRPPQIQVSVIPLNLLEARTLQTTVERLFTCEQSERSDRVSRLWERALGPARLFCSYGSIRLPSVTIHFLDPENTLAHAVLKTGEGGWAVAMEKADGPWTQTGVANSWVY